MEGLLVGSVMLLIIGAGILSARLCCYRKQVNHMLSELRAGGDEPSFNLSGKNRKDSGAHFFRKPYSGKEQEFHGEDRKGKQKLPGEHYKHLP